MKSSKGKVKSRSIKEFFTAHKRVVFLFAAFIIPVIIWLLVLSALNMYPFGSETSMFMDLKDQYSEFLASLRYVGKPDNSLLFNWSRSMGGNAVGLYAYYSGGLISFIANLFPVSMIYAAVTVIESLSIGLCGLSFAVFIEFGMSKRGTHFSFLAFSTSYALMSYFVVYSSCFMWLVGGYFLPIVMLGIEQILKKKKGLLFYLALSAAIVFNYYTAYMIIIFSFMYFVFRVVSEFSWSRNERKASFKSTAVAFGKYSGLGILSGITALPVLLPVYDDLLRKIEDGLRMEPAGQNFPLVKIFHKFLPGQYDSITMPEDGSYPSIYVGVVMLAFVLVYFFYKKIKLKEKIVAAVIIILFILSFWIQKLDVVWMGFQRPYWFPYRYAFVFGFFLVLLAFKGYEKCIGNRKHIPSLIPLAIIAVCCIELFCNTKVCVKGLGKQFNYMKTSELEDFVASSEPLVKTAKDLDDSLYRMTQDYEFSKNDAMLLGYNGMTHYSSTYNLYVNEMTRRLGLAQTYKWNSGYGATPLVESVFGIRFKLAKKSVPSFYEKTDSVSDVSLYENSHALPFIFAADPGCKDAELDEDVFSNQDKLLYSLVGEGKSYFNPVSFERSDEDGQVSFKLNAQDDKPLYMYLDSTDLSWGDVFVNDQWVNNCFSSETSCVIYLGTFSPGDEVNVTVKSDYMAFDDVQIESLDTELMIHDLDKLQENSLDIYEHKGSTVEGEIIIPAGKTIATTIPYDDGYKITIDDKDVAYEKWLDTFLCFDAPAGDHEIKITYSPPGYGIGWFACWCALICAFVYFAFGLFKKNKVEAE